MTEPIAIIGLGCRFPGGADSPDKYWDLLRDGKDVISEVPRERWNVDTFYNSNPKAPGKTVSRWGGFIDDCGKFDARFFGISPREAVHMDPQHRILLECAWQALEDGGQVLDKLSGSPTGVFIGASSMEYRTAMKGDLDAIDAHTGTGAALSIAANRISYIFDFKGPSFVVDTACSSSLVATHLACQSIWNGECTLALVGGVNIMLSPDLTIALGKGGMLALDGKCRAFDADGKGYVRGEGAGIVVLKPLSAALADKDPIKAVILSTVVNQDGHTVGMPVPDLHSQENMLREACRKAGVSPNKIQFIEAHGTGTPVGDPIEANALGKVVGSGRPAGDNCLLGSVKSNIGHLESASGVASLIKAVLAMTHKQIPPNLHFSTPNPEIKFGDYHLEVPTKLTPWPERKEPALAGVNSFGFGGTNAHVILQESPLQTSVDKGEPVQPGRPPYFLPLSARSSEALRELVSAFLDAVLKKNSCVEKDLEDLCYTAGARRNHHDHRLALTAYSMEELRDGFSAFLNEESMQGIASGRASLGRAPRLAFVFSGQGPQWWGMARQLIEHEPVFRDAIKKCDELFKAHASWSLWHELHATETSALMHETHVAQPAIFSIQVGLAELFKSWGIEPQAVVGHSIGEAAAMHVAGIYSLKEAVRIVYHRGRLLHQMHAMGKMAVVRLSRDEAKQAIARAGNNVDIAAVNSPQSVTLSGDRGGLENIIEELKQKEILCRFLKVHYAFHSYQMEPAREELLESLSGLDSRTADIPFYSTVTGKLEKGADLREKYWWSNVRNPVLFYNATEKLIQEGFDIFLELSPNPVLSGSIGESLRRHKRKGTVLPSLRRNEDDRKVLLNTLGKLYCMGFNVNWKGFYPEGGKCVSLPGYPWQKEYYWHQGEDDQFDQYSDIEHPFLGRRIKTSNYVWQARLDRRLLTFLGDHVALNSAIFPAAGYVESALAAAGKIFEEDACSLEAVEFLSPLVLPKNKWIKTQFQYDPTDATFKIHYLADREQQSWTLCVAGSVHRAQKTSQHAGVDLEELRRRCGEEVPTKNLYEMFNKMGLAYGPAFQGIQRSWRGEGEALGQIKQPPSSEDRSFHLYRLYPTVLDAAFQVSGLIIDQTAMSHPKLFLPVGIKKLRFYGTPAYPLWAHAKIVKFEKNVAELDIRLFDETGKVWVDCQGFRCRAIDPPKQRDLENTDNWLYRWKWEPCALKESEAPVSVNAIVASPAIMEESLNEEADKLSQRLQRGEYYSSLEPQLEKLASLYVRNAFERLGVDFQDPSGFTSDSLVNQTGIKSDRQALMETCLGILERQDVLKRSGKKWTVIPGVSAEGPQGLWKALINQFPGYLPELNLLKGAGDHLSDILTGKLEDDRKPFPMDDAAWEHFFQDSNSSKIYNLLLQKGIKTASANPPQGRKLRILEVGGGGGEATSYILQGLSGDNVEYIFSDPSEQAIGKARQKFRDLAFVDYQKFDIRSDDISSELAAQNFSPHSFDIVIAANSFSGVTDLCETLKKIKSLIASEGMLLALERTRQAAWLDLIAGALGQPGKGGRASLAPSRSFGEWKDLLEEAGFNGVAAFGDRGQEDSLQTVIHARCPNMDLKMSSSVKTVAKPETAGAWLIFADEKGESAKLAESLQSVGESCVVVKPGPSFDGIQNGKASVRPDEFEDVEKLIASVATESIPLRGIVHMWSLDLPDSDSLNSSSLERAEVQGCLSAMFLVRALANVKLQSSFRLFFITRGAQALSSTSDVKSVAQASLWGLAQVIRNEHQNLGCKTIDLDPERECATSLLHELLEDNPEEEIILRNSQRFELKLVRTDSRESQGRSEISEIQEAPPFAVEVRTLGVLDKFKIREIERKDPGRGEIEVRVVAAALNFRDVMIAMGVLPGEMEGKEHIWESLGLECSGVVTAIGEGVEGVKVGDEVVALSSGGCFASHTILPAIATVPKPDRLSFEEAATVPMAFLTAWYMMHYAGKLEKGESILIHAASGGVGMAAVQIALYAGAEVFATAGTPEKRNFVRGLGVKHVFDSRSLDFADEILEITGGQGVDLVLNSLAGPFISKSVSLLKPFGRFLEIGKRDIYENNKVGLRPFLKGLSFTTMVDIRQAFRDRGEFFRTICLKLMDHVRDKHFFPLPHRVFPVSNIGGAFRTMAQARHLGKIVISMDAPDPNAIMPGDFKKSFQSDATYLITGGLGGFGLAIAQWMAMQGARHIVLVGRSGAASEETKAVLKELEGSGAQIQVMKADVSHEKDVANVLEKINRTMPPLKGIFHAAMVLDDGFIIHLNKERLQRVMRPKVQGGWNLHRQTLGIDLDFFVLFSSVANIIGNPGQANYVAANSFIESLAQMRRARNLPAMVINWAPLTEVGVAARQRLNERLEDQGILSLSPQQAVDMLGKMMDINPVQIMVTPINWKKLFTLLRSKTAPRRFSHLWSEGPQGEEEGDEGQETGEPIRPRLQAVSPEERPAILAIHLRKMIGKVLELPPGKLELDQSLTDVGLDSLMAMELIVRMENDLEISIPVVRFLGGPSIDQMVPWLLEEMQDLESVTDVPEADTASTNPVGGNGRG